MKRTPRCPNCGARCHLAGRHGAFRVHRCANCGTKVGGVLPRHAIERHNREVHR